MQVLCSHAFLNLTSESEQTDLSELCMLLFLFKMAFSGVALVPLLNEESTLDLEAGVRRSGGQVEILECK